MKSVHDSRGSHQSIRDPSYVVSHCPYFRCLERKRLRLETRSTEGSSSDLQTGKSQRRGNGPGRDKRGRF